MGNTWGAIERNCSLPVKKAQKTMPLDGDKLTQGGAMV
jgi:hypothetical protein